jgi:hypothetical protein
VKKCCIGMPKQETNGRKRYRVCFFDQDVARRAYVAVEGTGYGRVDIRFRKRDECDPFVLEVNSNCGLSFGEMSSSLGEVLNLSKVPPEQFCRDLIAYALKRAYGVSE